MRREVAILIDTKVVSIYDCICYINWDCGQARVFRVVISVDPFIRYDRVRVGVRC